ncbi:MAG: hypothetical protein AAFU85_24000 [Planctomycetota bacterium]
MLGSIHQFQRWRNQGLPPENLQDHGGMVIARKEHLNDRHHRSNSSSIDVTE